MAEQFAARSPATAPRRAAVPSRRPSARSTVATATSWSCSAVSRWPSRPTSVVQAAAALAALPDVKFLSRAAARQRARRARPRAHPRLPARPGHARRRPRALHRRVGQRPRRSPASTPPGSSSRRRRHHRHPGAAGRRARGGLPRPRSACAPGSTRCRSSSRWARSPPTPPPAPTCSCPPRSGVRRAAAPPTSRAGCMRQARLVTPEGIDHGRLAHRPGARARFGADFGFEPSRTCRTRSRGSRRRTRASTPSLIRRARDGAVLPIADFPDEIVFQHVLGVTTGRSWEPIKPGVAADESHLGRSGTGASNPAGPAPTRRSSPGSRR